MKGIIYVIRYVTIIFIFMWLVNRFHAIGFLIASFYLMNYTNRAWIRHHQKMEIDIIRLSSLEKLILFPGIPNPFNKGNVRFQRWLVFNTIVSLILMSTVSSSNIMIILQLVAVAIHFMIHIFLVMIWVK